MLMNPFETYALAKAMQRAHSISTAPFTSWVAEAIANSADTLEYVQFYIQTQFQCEASTEDIGPIFHRLMSDEVFRFHVDMHNPALEWILGENYQQELDDLAREVTP